MSIRVMPAQTLILLSLYVLICALQCTVPASGHLMSNAPAGSGKLAKRLQRKLCIAHVVCSHCKPKIPDGSDDQQSLQTHQIPCHIMTASLPSPTYLNTDML